MQPKEESNMQSITTTKDPVVTVDLSIVRLKSSSDLTALTSLSESSYCGDEHGDWSSFENDDDELQSTLKSLADLTMKSEADPTVSSTEHHVRFSSVRIREYPICIGDNPSSFRGPPITLEWDYATEKEVPIEESERKRKRTSQGLQLSELKRMVLLHNCGFHKSDIKRAILNVNDDRSRRRETIEGLKWAKAHECAETLKRAILNATTKRGEKKRERELLKPYRNHKLSPISSGKKQAVQGEVALAA
jgi:hypothetical protein